MARRVYVAQAIVMEVRDSGARALARVQIDDVRLERLPHHNPTQGAMVLRGTIDGIDVAWFIPRSIMPDTQPLTASLE